MAFLNTKNFNISNDINIHQMLYLILGIASIIFFFINAYLVKPIIIELNDSFGLMSHMTLFYWLGLALIVFCSILLYLDIKQKSTIIYIFILFVVGLFLFGLDIFTQTNPRDPTTYYPAGEIKNILGTGIIDTISEYPHISYRYWPGFHIISAFIINIVGIELYDILKYFTLFWILIVNFMTFNIGKSLKFSSNQSFLLSVYLLSSYWLIQTNYSPQSFAFIIYLILFRLMLMAKMAKTYILILISFSSMVILHILTSFYVLIVTLIQMVYRKFIRKDIYLTALLVILFLWWYIYLAPVIFSEGLTRFVEQSINLDFYHLTTQKTTDILTPYRQKEVIVRASYLIIYAILVIIACIKYYNNKINIDTRKYFQFCLMWLFGTVVLTSVRYGYEVNQRAYMFSLIPVICIIFLSFSKKYIYIVIMVLFIVLHPFAYYGFPGSYGDQTLTTELKGAEFFATHINTTNEFFYEYPDKYFHSIPFYIPYYNPDLIRIPQVKFTISEDIKYSVLDNFTYIIDSKQSYNRDLYDFGFYTIKEWLGGRKGQKTDLLYNNGYFDLYRNRVFIWRP